MPAIRKTSSPKDPSAKLGFEAALALTACRPQGSPGVPPASSEIGSGQDGHAPLRADYVLAAAVRDSAIPKAKPCRRACRRQDNPMPFNPALLGTKVAWVQHFIHNIALAA